MGWYLQLMGLYFTVVGVIGLLTPKTLQTLVEGLMKKNLKALGVVTMVIGGLLLLAAVSSKARLFIVILSLLTVTKGIGLFLLPEKDIQEITTWWLAAHDLVKRAWCTIAVIIGLVVFLSVK